MPYVTPNEIEKARQMDLLTYLKNYEPDELVVFSKDTYTTKTHDSLKISNGKWMWWSRGFGGASALDYLVKVKNIEFTTAVKMIVDTNFTVSKTNNNQPKNTYTKPLLLPKKSNTNDKITQYLLSRGIDKDIINYCIKNKLIYESLPYHNLVFIGYDESKNPKYAAFRSTNQERIMGDCSGSDKTYSFRILGNKSNKVHIFESAIDLLSYATLCKLQGMDISKLNLISLAGVYATKENLKESKTPKTLKHYLKNHENIHTIYLHLDNDIAGKNATNALILKLSEKYKVIDSPPKYGKDYNDFLLFKLENKKINIKKRKEFER